VTPAETAHENHGPGNRDQEDRNYRASDQFACDRAWPKGGNYCSTRSAGRL